MNPKNDISAQRLLRDLILAGHLLTRLPLPRVPDADFSHQPQAAWAYPIAGLAVAGAGTLAGLVALAFGFGPVSAAGVALTAQILATGAMHEDGLADTCDGFWGGNDRARRLEIMKDSAIGTYGVLALIVSVGLRWAALAQILSVGFWGLFAAAALSRGFLPGLMSALPPARPEGLAGTVGRPPARTSAIALALGLVIAMICAGGGAFLAALLALAGIVVLALTARAKIGGQTGDVLGAAQQVAEILILLALAARL